MTLLAAESAYFTPSIISIDISNASASPHAYHASIITMKKRQRMAASRLEVAPSGSIEWQAVKA